MSNYYSRYRFLNNETNITVTFDGIAMNLTACEGTIQDGNFIAANGSGSWQVTFVLPVKGGGIYEVDAMGANTSSSIVENINYTISSAIGITEIHVRSGMTINITGTGCQNKEDLGYIYFKNISYIGTILGCSKGDYQNNSITASTEGIFKCQVGIPNGLPSQFVIVNSSINTKYIAIVWDR